MYSLDRSKQNIALVVDDNPESLGMVATALEEHGMTVLVARNGNAAIDLVSRVDPDVVLMDAMMPAPDGFETCRLLKTSSTRTEAPIIFMTGLSDPEHILKGLDAGGVDYITKPVVIDELVARISVHIGNSKLLQSARAALDNSGYALLALKADTSLSWGSPGALALLEDSGLDLSESSDNRQELQNWLMVSSKGPLSETKPLEIAGITLSFVGLAGDGDFLIKINNRNATSTDKALCEAFGLTDREGEVLYWLSLGKSNKDIAEILSLSARTVNKHLEQIFTKLGVDNRTSAAVMADRVLHSYPASA